MKKIWTIIITLIAVAATGGLLTACGGTTTGEGARTESFTWWIPAGVDSSYYDSYEKNPVVEYLASQKWEGDNQEEVYIDLSFLVPVSGSELNNIVTLISTGEYPDIMDIQYYLRAGSVSDLYDQGIALDLTYYVENYMPNYLAYLETRPDLAQTAVNYVDGEARYLMIYGYGEGVEMWGGWEYRRDWIVKYGENPTTHQPFVGGFDDEGVWTDDVVFPSGYTIPYYISDWEWMLQIFEDAIDAENIIGGYPMSMNYPGYFGTGDLVCSFGGGAPAWYKDGDTIKFGATGEGFRTYLKCVSQWYANGWIDQAFTEHTSEIFYQIDQTKVFQGKVGVWWGTQGSLENKMDISDGEPNSPTNGYTNGIMVCGARQPINDIYGDESEKGVTPFAMYQFSSEGSPTIVTDKAKDKDLVALFTMMDYLYGEEGSLLKTFGLNAEQVQTVQNEFMSSQGLTDGVYSVVNVEGVDKYLYAEPLIGNTPLKNAACGLRLVGLSQQQNIISVNTPTWDRSLNEWIVYTNTGFFPSSFTGQLSATDSVNYAKLESNVNDFLQRNVPAFVMGSKDPNSDADWIAFLAALNKYHPETNTQMLQTLLDHLNG